MYTVSIVYLGRQYNSVSTRHSLLSESLIRARLAKTGEPARFSLPALLAALAHDEVRDFPAVRPHQRHPWHAFLVQVAAMALHRAGRSQPFTTEQEWTDALLELTPEHPDGSAWCLLTPHDKPAFMQAPVPGGDIAGWKNRLPTPDGLDMLVTAKNHDLKQAQMRNAQPDDWAMALISLQTQEGFLGKGNYGVSRMNGGFANRPALGVIAGSFGQRWQRDVAVLLANRDKVVADMGLRAQGGLGLLWTAPWDGNASLAFEELDPYYIEVCRRIRLTTAEGTDAVCAVATGSSVARVDAKERNGVTGDPWTPVDVAAGTALAIGKGGFHYPLAAELLFGSKYRRAITQTLEDGLDGPESTTVVAQGVARGKGKTGGYHERRIPVSPKVRKLLRQKKTDILAETASARVDSIAKMRSVLWVAVATLLDRGVPAEKFSDSAAEKAKGLISAFEQGEDARFFDELNIEVESDDPQSARLQWLVAMASRAEVVLKNTFIAGPQNAELRYRAQSAALSRFHGALRGDKTFPSLANYYRGLSATHKDATHELD